MLHRRNRLTRKSDIAETVRSGRRAGGRRLVVHLCSIPSAAQQEPRVALAVSRAVGPAVQRNRVSRQVRHLMRDRIGQLPPGSMVVIRLLPGAAGSTSEALGRDLDSALSRAAGS